MNECKLPPGAKQTCLIELLKDIECARHEIQVLEQQIDRREDQGVDCSELYADHESAKKVLVSLTSEYSA